jgi:hypothetical protein
VAQLIYNGVDLGREIRTMSYSVEPVMDPLTGIDLLCQHVTIEVMVVVNPYWLATNKPGNLPAGELSPGTAGDRMGLTMANLRRVLLEPRGLLVFNVGPDTSLTSPQIDPATSRPLPADCKNGPRPLYCRVTELLGDKSGFLFFGIETWVEDDCEAFVLSNRWASTCTVDQEGYTTRVTRGKTCFRSDFMHWERLTPDQFRALVIIPTQDDLQRVGLTVSPSADGLELDWQVVDQEVTYGTGNREGFADPLGGVPAENQAPDSRITRIEGNTTHGGHIEIHDLKGAATKVGGSLRKLAFGSGGGVPFVGPVVDLFMEVVPSCRANCLVRVFGQRRCSKKYMARVAMMVALDRFGGILTRSGAVVVGSYLMQDIGSQNAPFIELRLEFLTGLQQLFVVLDPDTAITGGVRLDTELKTLGCRFETPPPELPYSDNTRGSWVSSLAYQALSAGCPNIQPPLPTTGGAEAAGIK